jgi:Protein of unknown function (DUF3551)
MKTIGAAFCVATLVALGLGSTTRPSAAMVIYPWCAHYLGRMGGVNCGFTSFQQCLLTLAGNGGSCDPNPWYLPYPPPTSYAPPLWR